MIPRSVVPAVVPEALPKWHRCPDCDVHWRGHDDECWSCGKTVPGALTSAPQLNSQGGTACAMTEGMWSRVRQEIGVD